MNILTLVDKFKGTLTSNEIGKITKDILSSNNTNVDYFPISDGGNGFLDSIYSLHNTKRKYCYVHNANNIIKRVMYLMDNEKVYIEVAKIIGLEKNQKLNIFNATSFGVGEVILNAIKNGGKDFYIGLGGTITNDGGKGMLEALGFIFNNDNIITPTNIDFTKIKFNIISDVESELLGEHGATYVFAKQKGAKEHDLPILEKRMIEYSSLITAHLKKDFTFSQGAGAAGGLGFAFLSLLNAKFHLGIDFILNYLNINNIIDKYDLIITGEGKVDEQSLQGKVALKILNTFNKPTIIICGMSELTNKITITNLIGIYSIVPTLTTFSLSVSKPKFYLRKLLKKIANENHF